MVSGLAITDDGCPMAEFVESALEFANFTFERKKVVCYGLQNAAGGTTTILNFPSEGLADAFHERFCRAAISTSFTTVPRSSA